MSNRRNQILAAILAVQIVLAIVLFWPRSTVSEAANAPLLSDFKAADVAGIVITDRDGNSVELARSGDAWVLPQRDEFPALTDRVNELLGKIEKIRTNRLITQTEGSHKTLQVSDNDFVRKIELRGSNSVTHTLYIGVAGGGSAVHVRADDRPEVYLTSEVLSWDVNAQEGNWVDTLFLTVPQTATVGITLQNANGVFEFERPDGEGQWTMKGLAAGETVVDNNVLSVVNQTTSLRMQSPLGKTSKPEYGMDKPQATVTLKTREGDQERTYTLTIGARLEDEKPRPGSSDKVYYYVARSSESPYFVRVSDWVGDALVNKKREDFLQAPATPTANAEGVAEPPLPPTATPTPEPEATPTTAVATTAPATPIGTETATP